MLGKWGTLYTLQEDEITHGLDRNGRSQLLEYHAADTASGQASYWRFVQQSAAWCGRHCQHADTAGHQVPLAFLHAQSSTTGHFQGSHSACALLIQVL